MNIKFNWGTGIVLAFIGFISFIMFFVYRMSVDNKAQHDLVTEEYYKAELGYQKEIDAEDNASKMDIPVAITYDQNGLLIKFPSGYDHVTGSVVLYRPSNKRLDFELPLTLTANEMRIPDEQLVPGRWDLRISWKYHGTDFLIKKNIFY